MLQLALLALLLALLKEENNYTLNIKIENAIKRFYGVLIFI